METVKANKEGQTPLTKHIYELVNKRDFDQVSLA